MNSLETLWYQISISCIKICLIAMPFLFYMQAFEAILGLIIGTAFALFKLHLMAGSVKKAAGMRPEAATTYTYSRFIIRQAITVLVLVSAMFVDQVNFFWVVGGLILPKFVIVGGQVFDSLKKSNLKFFGKAAQKKD